MTRLEDFILENRAQLDDAEKVPNPDFIWEKVAIEINPPQPKKKFTFRISHLAIAASFGLLIGLGTMFLIHKSPKNNNIITSALPEFADQASAYQTLVNQQFESLGDRKVLKQQFPDEFRELDQLKQMQLEYLKVAAQINDRHAAMETLIKFYEREIKILKRLQLAIEKRKKYDEKRDEEITI